MVGENSYIGKEIGNYRIVEIIARGGFGTVCKAQHKRLRERFVAIKFLHAYLASDYEHKKFFEEAELLEKLKHSHILYVIDVGIDEANGNDSPYIITDFAPNGTLRDRIKNTSLPPLSVEESIIILSQIAEALQEVHANDIIHRDIKPSNVLFDAKGNVLLADFGIAKILDTTSGDHTAHLIGTPAYMAPEQFDGKVSKKCDLYALGCLAYELFTEKKPFTGDRDELEQKHKYGLPKPPRTLNSNIPEYIEQAILKALAKSPADRHKNVSEFVGALISSSPQPGISTPSSVAGIDNKTKESISPSRTLDEKDDTKPNMDELHQSQGTPTIQASSPLVVPAQQPDPPSVHPTISITKPAYTGRMPNSVVASINSSSGQPLAIPASQSIGAIPPLTVNQVAAPVIVPGGGGNAGHPPRQRRSGWQLLLIALNALLLLSLLLCGGIALAAPGTLGSFGNAMSHIIPGVAPPTATVTIMPKIQDLSNSYVLTGVISRVPDANKRQVQARQLTFTSQPASKTVNATGVGHISVTYATGAITFYNSRSFSQTVGAGTVFTISGVQIVTDVPAVIPAAHLPTTGFVTVSAHALTTGPSGNIGAYAINGACCFNGVAAQNTQALTGGQSQQDLTNVQQSDIDGAAISLIAQLTPTAKPSFNALKHANEQFVNAPQCNPNVSSDHRAGDKASNVTVKVTVTCSGVVYDQSGSGGVQAVAETILKGEAPADITKNDPTANSADYALQENTFVAKVTQATIDKNKNVILQVNAEGIWVYQYTPAKLAQLKTLIAGKSSDTAKTLLAGQPGVSLVDSIVLSDNSSTLPTDVNLINIVVKQIPGVQGTPTVTPGTPGGGTPTPVGTLTSPVANLLESKRWGAHEM